MISIYANLLEQKNASEHKNSCSTPRRFSWYTNIAKHGGRFLVLEHVLEQQYSRRDVMWKRSIGSERKKKKITRAAHVLHLLKYISLPSLQDQEEEFPLATFMEDRKHTTTNFSFPF